MSPCNAQGGTSAGYATASQDSAQLFNSAHHSFSTAHCQSTGCCTTACSASVAPHPCPAAQLTPHTLPPTSTHRCHLHNTWRFKATTALHKRESAPWQGTHASPPAVAASETARPRPTPLAPCRLVWAGSWSLMPPFPPPAALQKRLSSSSWVLGQCSPSLSPRFNLLAVTRQVRDRMQLPSISQFPSSCSLLAHAAPDQVALARQSSVSTKLLAALKQLLTSC